MLTIRNIGVCVTVEALFTKLGDLALRGCSRACGRTTLLRGRTHRNSLSFLQKAARAEGTRARHD